MSVYTEVSLQSLNALLTRYDIGSLISWHGIEAGIENSNYRLLTSRGQYILTLYESLPEPEVLPVLTLLHQLNLHGFPAPECIVDKTGQTLHWLQGKRAAIFQCIPGASVENPTASHCFAIGEYLARLHQLSPQLSFVRHNSRDLSACQSLFQQLAPVLPPNDRALLESELSFQRHRQCSSLPAGVIHADLFRDNVLFVGDVISGLLDFYSACQGVFILDLAISCNDWCVINGIWQPDLCRAILDGYQTIRRLTPDEQALWPLYCRFAALRFCLSRHYHQQFPREGALTQQKDPDVFRRLLAYHIAQTQSLNFFNSLSTQLS
ncbi:homoserine kinase [methane-oxidizing endosymbiont of Gigantopelta aegis]|uniref:homoserine kinase n=1 Tax=methane-oxidizing endosymbiont of Gigantopelta aegis TaxID=2794938 RepID=UPI0018DBCBCA|nr:homoserine kinase [methane-oxidizing endosymbiont of Gigantopelta aegis]